MFFYLRNTGANIFTAVELSHKKTRGTIAGFIMLLTAVAPALSNIPIGTTIQNFGWNYFFATLCGCAVLSALAIWLCRPLKINLQKD